MKRLARFLPLLLVLLALPGYALDGPAGTVLKASPGALGEFVVQLSAGHTLQRGDVVSLRRTPQEPALGEAFLIRLSGSQGVISLKGDFKVSPGDLVYFARRPGGASAPAQPGPAAAGTLLQDPKGKFTLKLRGGWKTWSQEVSPDILALVGPSGQLLLMASQPSANPAQDLANPKTITRALQIMKSQMQVKVAATILEQGDLQILRRVARRQAFRTADGKEGYVAILPGADYLFIAAGLADTRDLLDATVPLLFDVQLK